jgi:hypothetical protein
MESGIQTKRSTSSDSKSEDLSEPITILGKGVPSFNAKYGCLTHCVAGIGKNSSWIRLYPLFAEQVIPKIQFVENFDIIRAKYRDVRPESTRPETRKIHPESVVKIDHVKDHDKRMRILKQYTEPGTFLHDDSWNGRKTLGMIEPLEKHFLVSSNIPKVKFYCRSSCGGHTCELKQLERFDSFGRVVPEPVKDLENRLKNLQGKQLRFVMGTDGRHPQVWLIVSVHIMEVS